MAVMEDLSNEILFVILSSLDWLSLKYASDVCVSWRRVVHDITNPSNCDSELHDKLEKCGWIMNEHDVERCKCIDLNLGLLKFIGNNSLSYKDVLHSADPYHDVCYAMAKDKLFATRGWGDEVVQVEVLHLTQDVKSGNLHLDMYMENYEEKEFERRIKFCAFDNTLAISEAHEHLIDIYGEDGFEGYDSESDYSSLVTGEIANLKKLHLWNLETLKYVSVLNITERVMTELDQGFKDEDENGIKIEIKDILLSKDKLGVHLRISSSQKFQDYTQIWKIDTSNPSSENISYWTTIKHDQTTDKKLLMNSKFLCTVAVVHSLVSSEVKLNIYRFDNLTEYSTKVLATMPRKTKFDIKLEQGVSHKLAIFERQRRILHIYELDNLARHITIRLTNNCKIQMSNFFMGKIMLLKRNPSKKREFQFLIVTESGDVIDGNKIELECNKLKENPNFRCSYQSQLTKLGCYKRFNNMTFEFHVDVGGMVVLASDKTDDRFYLALCQ